MEVEKGIVHCTRELRSCGAKWEKTLFLLKSWA